jgi:hypothetical protein
MWNKFTRGEALIDVVIGTTLIGFFVISTFNVLLGILKESGQITKRIQANWVANSYMEQITHFPFTDPDDTDPEDGSDRDDVDDFDDYSVVNYGLTVTVNVNDAEVDAGIISFSELPLDNPDFKQVRVTISDGGLSEPIELKTLVPLDALPPPYITEIYTDYECPERICGDNESSREYAEQVDNIPIKVVFDREISVSNIGNITLTLKNVTESVTYGTDGIEGDMWYHDNLLNELVDNDELLEGYGDDLVSKVSEGQDPITATGSSISGDNLELTFTYERGEPDAKYHTSTTFDDYLDVEKINLNGETIQGLVNGEPDGVQALDEDEDGFIDLPIEDELMLFDDKVIILNQPATFYIFYEESGDAIDGWEQVQKVVNPAEVQEMDVPTMGDIFDQWKRFDGITTYDNRADARGNSLMWTPNYDDDNVLESFSMALNVDPPSGFVSPDVFEDLTLETTFLSTHPRSIWPRDDNDMIGLIIAYEEGSNYCSISGAHDPETCTNIANETVRPYAIIAARTGGGSVPNAGWGLVYGRTDRFKYSHKNWYDNEVIIDDYSDAVGNLLGRYVRIRIERSKHLLKAYTTAYHPAQAATKENILTEPFLSGSAELTADLTSDRRFHKFLGGKRDGGSSYGYITFSQPQAQYLDNIMPLPEVERNVDYVIYFHNREDTDDDGIYDTWAPFDLTVDNATGDNGRDLAAVNQRSGIWKWDETVDPARWVFRENALNELLGRTVQEAAGHYRIITPDEEMFDGDHMFTDMIGSPASGDVSDKYLIRSRLEASR